MSLKLRIFLLIFFFFQTNVKYLKNLGFESRGNNFAVEAFLSINKYENNN